MSIIILSSNSDDLAGGMAAKLPAEVLVRWKARD
jgi:hypothetical protein